MNEACTGTVLGQIVVNKTGQSCSILHKKRWKFKGPSQAHSVRDEGVAGSNPATPTSFSSLHHLRGQLCGTKGDRLAPPLHADPQP
jgi:hypothetical protein